MKLSITPPNDGRSHSYCLRCQSEISSSRPTTGAVHRCAHCGHKEDRALIIDPAIEWWTDQSGEYWHETVGVFLANERGEFLFFERTRFPYGLTVPAGHRDRGEQTKVGALRELREETDITLRELKLLGIDAVMGDQCRRGSDAHMWHSFVGTLPARAAVKVDRSEGMAPTWLSLEAAQTHKLCYATRYILTKRAAHLRAYVR